MKFAGQTIFYHSVLSITALYPILIFHMGNLYFKLPLIQIFFVFSVQNKNYKINIPEQFLLQPTITKQNLTRPGLKPSQLNACLIFLSANWNESIDLNFCHVFCSFYLFHFSATGSCPEAAESTGLKSLHWPPNVFRAKPLRLSLPVWWNNGCCYVSVMEKWAIWFAHTWSKQQNTNCIVLQSD